MAEKGFNGINRDTWTDGVRNPRLRAACKAKVAFHKSRVAYWTKLRDAAKKKFEKHGMKLVERPQFGEATVAYSSNKVRTAEIDHDLAEDWQTYNRKVEQHKAKVREYEKWVVFFDPASCDTNDGDEGSLELTFADMDFFGLLGGAEPKDD